MTNLIERLFGEDCRRLKAAPKAFGEKRAIEANHSRNWLAHIVAAEVRSA
jgi:hypothetical protein